MKTNDPQKLSNQDMINENLTSSEKEIVSKIDEVSCNDEDSTESSGMLVQVPDEIIDDKQLVESFHSETIGSSDFDAHSKSLILEIEEAELINDDLSDSLIVSDDNSDLPDSIITNNISEKNENTEVSVITVDYSSLSQEELNESLDILVKTEDISLVKEQVAQIKVAFLKLEKENKESVLDKFIKDGGKKESFIYPETPVLIRFNEIFNVYKEKRNALNQLAEKEKADNLIKKNIILDELRKLIDSGEDLKKTYDAFKALQDKWKEIGHVTRSENNNLWQSYHFLVEKFFDKVRISNELKDLDLKKNFEIKVGICEKTEELIFEPSITNAFTLLQKYHEVWRDTGLVPLDKKEELWERFRSATEKINDRRREHIQKLQAEHQANYHTKIALCEKAESIIETEINSAKEWYEKTNTLNELLVLWKNVGPAFKKENEEVWKRFRTAISSFFTAKKEYFDKLKEEQINNYNQKVNLCIQAESLKDSNNWKKATEELIKLQQEWKKIGTVPKKYSEKIWVRFRSACDTFFNNKSTFFANIDAREEENLQIKKDIIEKVKTFNFGDSNAENLQVIKDFQRQWIETGHVPIKVKNEIQQEFRTVINELFDKLKISAAEKTALSFKSKVENIIASPQSSQLLIKERSFLINKIAAIKNDIKLWENNIGFFANSKKADILKSEFQQKIDRAKQEILILEAKLKVLKDTK